MELSENKECLAFFSNNTGIFEDIDMLHLSSWPPPLQMSSQQDVQAAGCKRIHGAFYHMSITSGRENLIRGELKPQ